MTLWFSCREEAFVGELDDVFGELRSRVHAPRSTAAFANLCVWAQRLEERSPGAFDDRLREYAVEALRAWPLRLTTLRLDERAPEAFARAPWARMVRGVTLDGFASHPVARVAERMEHMPWREHLGIDGLQIRQRDFLQAIDDGLFDGLRSLEIRNCPLRVGTFAPLIERLSGLEGLAQLEELRLHHCDIKAAHVEALCASGLPERLRVLGLSGNTSLKTKGVKALLASSGRFGRLERLELEDTGLNNAAAKLLATSTLPPRLAHVGLGVNELKAAGLEALAKAGRVKLLVDREGEVSLDTTNFAFGEAALLACVDDGMFEGVERWRMGGWRSELSGAEALRASGALQGVTSIDLRDLVLLREHQDELVEVFEGLTVGLRELRWKPWSCELLERLLAAPALAEARVLDVHDYRTVFGARGLNALLAWPGLDAAEVVNARFQVKRGSDEYDRAVASGVLFEESSEVARAQVFLSSRRRGRAEVQDVSVTLDGRLSREWLNTYRHDH